VEATPGSGLAHGYIAPAEQDPRPQSRFGRHLHTPVVRYSPDGQMLALASHDGFVDLLAVNPIEGGSGYRQISHCRGHATLVLNVDWAKNSRVLRTQDGSNKLLYWEAPSGTAVKTAKLQKVRMVEWATSTCTVGWSVRGVHQAGMNGTDVNAVRVSPDGGTLAAVDDFGLLRLYAYPSVHQKQVRISCFSPLAQTWASE
jgi:WD40 repeat protein